MTKHRDFWDVMTNFHKNSRRKNGPVNLATVHRSPMGREMINNGGLDAIYTGAGANGQVEPHKPALIDMSSGSPAIVHEGEIIRNVPNGKQVVSNNDVRAGIIPLETEDAQQSVSNLERFQQLEGFRHGGHMKTYRGGGIIPTHYTGEIDPPFVIPGIPIPAFRGGGMIPGYQEGGLIAPPQEQAPLTGGAPQFGAPTPTSLQPIQTPPPAGIAPSNPVPTPLGQQAPAALPGQTGAAQGQGLIAPPVAPQQAQSQIQPPIEKPAEPTDLTKSPLDQKERPVTQQDITDVGTGNIKFENLDEFKKGMLKSFSELQKIAGGDSLLFERLKEQMLGRAGNMFASQQAAQAQTSAQQELTPETARLLQGQLGRQQALERGEIVQGIANQESQAQINAQQQLFQQSLIGTQFEQQQLQQQATLLMQQGGTQNLEQASQILTKLYGSPVDLQNLQFKQTMGAISDIVALNLGVEESVQMAINSGVLERFGITEEQLRQQMTPLIMGSNPIVNAQQMYQDLVGQGLISQQQADQIMALMTWKLTNPDGVVMTDSVAVVDANGKEISNFQTQEEADQFLAENKGQGYVSKIKQNGWFSLKGTEDDLSIKGKIEGEVFEQNGQLFQVIDGQKVPARINVGTPFSSVNEKLYEYYLARGDQARANEILNIQVELLRGTQPSSGKLRLPVGVSKDHPAVKWFLENREAILDKDIPIKVNSPLVTFTKTKKNKKTVTVDASGQKVVT